MSARLLAPIAISSLLFLGCFGASTWQLGGLDPNILHLQLTYSETAFRTVLACWGEDGVARFESHFAWDFGTLASYAVFGNTVGRWIVERVREAGLAATLLPWLLAVAAIADFAENILHLRFIGAAAAQPDPMLFPLAGACATAKLVLLAAWLLLALMLLRRR